jgi:hypothetical protein
MWIGEGICGVCLSSIDEESERKAVHLNLIKTNR